MLRIRMKDGEVFEGESFLDLVSAMKGATMFSDIKNVLEYVAVVQERAKEMEGIELVVTGEKIDDRCESLVKELVRTRMAAVEAVPMSDVAEIARMVRLSAETLNSGDLPGAWEFLRNRLRMTEAERYAVEELLGLAKTKD